MKKRILSFLLLVCIVMGNLGVQVFAADGTSWKLETPMPTPRSWLGVAAVADKIYTMGGQNTSGHLNVVEIYDTKTGTWSTGTPMPIKLYAFDLAVVGDSIYIIGGYGVDGYKNTVYIYDTKSNTWRTGKPMPVTTSGPGVAAEGGKIFVTGGWTNTRSKALYIYDTKTDTWSTGAPMALERSSHGAEAVGGKVYIIGFLEALEIYDIKSNTWSTGRPFPKAGMFYGMSTLNIDNAIYSIGGNNSNEVYIYNTITNSWTQGSKTIEPRYYSGTAYVNGKIYAIGGVTTTGAYSNTMESLQVGNITQTPANMFSILLEIGQTTQIAISDDLSDNASLNWTSDNEEAAIVDSNGTVTAIGKGLAKITGTNIDGSHKESILIRTKLVPKAPAWNSINDNIIGEANNQIEYSSNWSSHSQIGAYNDDETYTKTPGSYFQVKFNGTGIKWHGALNNTCGMAAVYLDGNFIKNIDCYSAIRSDDELLFDSGEITLAQHILKIELLPEKNPDSIDYYITADRIEIKN